jgi:hypothetical protein
MAEEKNKKNKTPQKAPLSWAEMLVERVLARIRERDRQINESADRFEQRLREKNRQISESADRLEQQMRDKNRQINESADRLGQKIKENAGWKNRHMDEDGEWDDREMQGTAGQTGRKMKGTGRQIDRYSEDSMGYIDLPDLMQEFNELGFVFERSYKNATVKDKKHNIYYEIDITLESNDKIMIIMARNKPTTGDISGHIKRMRDVRRYGDLHGEKRKFIGAIYGIDFSDNVKLFAMKNGFYIIEMPGETFNITSPKGAYSPVEW